MGNAKHTPPPWTVHHFIHTDTNRDGDTATYHASPPPSCDAPPSDTAVRVLLDFIIFPVLLVIGWIILGIVAVFDVLARGTGNPDFPRKENNDTRTSND